MHLRDLGYLFVFALRMFDLPARIFIKNRTKPISLLRELNITSFNPVLLNLLCCLSDLLVSRSISSFDYFLLGAIFPCGVSSLENSVIHFRLTELYPLLCLYEPLYLLHLPMGLQNLSTAVVILEFAGKPGLSTLYHNGFDYNHLPGLNGFWYPFVCVVEQYSKLSYTLNLVYAKYLLGKEPRLFPVYRNEASFMSYLPAILRSPHLNLYVVVGLGFEYLYMCFKRNETVNTNFLYWTTLVFVGMYLYDLRFGALRTKR